MKHLFFSIVFLFLLFQTTHLQAKIILPDIISNHMVLQRKITVPIWGKATANSKIIQKFYTPNKTNYPLCNKRHYLGSRRSRYWNCRCSPIYTYENTNQ